ncbi:hypothetical protein BRADI_1g02970v3 [Brachypodium distachyon]|uniref:Serine-threonine/tyrosine-protein kinase catalytic domain-containing protein n=1 Tax=Brachypodium distachyon TaxID=15368 RepID=I1GLA7_BRADI|nr:hypothetical protein BRADI_1g02970v3 [Brachypodium distachyon]
MCIISGSSSDNFRCRACRPGVETVSDLKKLFSFAEQYGYADWICFDASVIFYDWPVDTEEGCLQQYSFGVVLLELLTGRKPVDHTMPRGQQNLVTWATPRLSEDKVKQCIDPRLKGEYPPKGWFRLAAVAALCVQYEAEFRPNMSIVLTVAPGAKIRRQLAMVYMRLLRKSRCISIPSPIPVLCDSVYSIHLTDKLNVPIVRCPYEETGNILLLDGQR